jgi:hypothetical protein
LIDLLSYFNLDLKFVSNKISGEIFNFKSPSVILIGPTLPRIFFNNISDLSKKKLKLVFSKFISFVISVVKLKTEPRAIKLFNEFFLSK